MAHKAPGKHLSLLELFKMFPDDATAEKWFAKTRWPEDPHCPHCGSVNVHAGEAHKTMPYRCRERECRKRFSVRTGTCMEASNLGFQIWATAIYLMSTSLKGVSSMELHRDLEITHKSTWYLAMRLRKALEDSGVIPPVVGPVEAEETYIGKVSWPTTPLKITDDTEEPPRDRTASYDPALDRSYQPRKGDLEKDVSVSVTPNRFAQAVVQGGAARRDN